MQATQEIEIGDINWHSIRDESYEFLNPDQLLLLRTEIGIRELCVQDLDLHGNYSYTLREHIHHWAILNEPDMSDTYKIGQPDHHK